MKPNGKVLSDLTPGPLAVAAGCRLTMLSAETGISPDGGMDSQIHEGGADEYLCREFGL